MYDFSERPVQFNLYRGDFAWRGSLPVLGAGQPSSSSLVLGTRGLGVQVDLCISQLVVLYA